MEAVSRPYLPRLVDPLIAELFDQLPALMLVGPRATGKTTTAARHVTSVVRLDQAAQALVFEADPDAALSRFAEPILLDEWQSVPGVLGAVKRAVDTDPRPGRFLLTGSVRAELDAPTWPGTGRVVRIDMTGLSVREYQKDFSGTSFLDRLIEGGIAALTAPSNDLDIGGYLDLAFRSGFPYPALSTSGYARRSWLESYVEQLITRDVRALGENHRDPQRLRRYLEAVALNTAGVVQHKTLYEAAEIDRQTADAYDRLLRDLLVLDVMPAWTTNRLKRLTRYPKRYLVDPALATGILGLDTSGALRDGDLLGRLLDTFVVAQLRAELPMCKARVRIHHLRQEHGRHEVDLVAEIGARQVIGIEVKAHAAPRLDAARHLVWLAEQLGDRFVAGVVLHTGPHIYELAPDIVAAPISTLWAG